MKIIEPELGYDAACSKHHLDNTSVWREKMFHLHVFRIIWITPFANVT